MVDESDMPTADGRQGIAKLASLPGDPVVTLARPESHALVVTFSRDGEESEEMFASDGQGARGNAITLIAKSEWLLLSGNTFAVRRTDEDLTIKIMGRPQGGSTASNLTTLNFKTLGARNE